MKVSTNFKKIIYGLFIAMVLISSCKKGEDGPAGANGANGATGAIGPAGADGSIMYSGAEIPATTVGKNGDYYLDKSTGTLYGPKVAAGWGTPMTLKGTNGTNGTNGGTGAAGTNGTNGTNGSTTLSGTTAPAATLGAIGDYYLDKTTYQLYGPKIATGWGVPILLRGAQGPVGPAGPQGPAGNANVKQYTFGSREFNSGKVFVSYLIPNITKAELDNSFILCYYIISTYSTNWYAAPGVGPSNYFQTRTVYNISGNDLQINCEILKLDGSIYTTPTTFTNFKIIIVPNSTNTTLANSRSKQDLAKMSYSDVCKTLKIAE